MQSDLMYEKPIILTLQLDHESQDYFNSLRKLHYPYHLNHLDAHVTLFHQLPGSQSKICSETENAARIGSFAIEVTDVFHTGFGVAYRLESTPLMQLHSFLKEAFYTYLTTQDRQPFRPHVTIQNKVSAEASRSLASQLRKGFEPFTATAAGINAWEYLGGPWGHIDFFSFHTVTEMKKMK